MNTHPMQIMAPDARQHSSELFKMLGLVFTPEKPQDFEASCRRNYIRHSHYSWDVSRIGVLDDRIVAHYGVWDYRMRVGSARLRTGGIGAVATHPDYRKRGLVSLVTRASIDAMTDAGYDMTLLFGIRNFYDRFGYVRAWNHTTFEINADEIPEGAGRVPLERFKVGVVVERDRLYNRQSSGATGTAVRPTFLRHGLGMSRAAGYAWRSNRKLAGYVIVRPPKKEDGPLCCLEYCGDAERAFTALRQLAKRWKCRSVSLQSIPYGSDLATRVRRLNSNMKIHFERCGGAMVRVLNLESCLRKLRGELGNRIRRSPMSTWSGCLRITDPRESVGLRIQRGRVRLASPGGTRHSIRAGEEFAQLIMGTDEPHEVVAAGRMRLTGDARQLLPILFPAQHPALGALDHF